MQNNTLDDSSKDCGSCRFWTILIQEEGNPFIFSGNCSIHKRVTAEDLDCELWEDEEGNTLLGEDW